MIRNISLIIILLLGSFNSIANARLAITNAIASDSVSHSEQIKNQTALKDTISDNAIVYPESMSEKLSDLLAAWQLELSTDELQCLRGQNVSYHDTIYANRLYTLPTVMELSYNQVVKSYIEMYLHEEGNRLVIC